MPMHINYRISIKNLCIMFIQIAINMKAVFIQMLLYWYKPLNVCVPSMFQWQQKIWIQLCLRCSFKTAICWWWTDHTPSAPLGPDGPNKRVCPIGSRGTDHAPSLPLGPKRPITRRMSHWARGTDDPTGGQGADHAQSVTLGAEVRSRLWWPSINSLLLTFWKHYMHKHTFISL